MGRDGDEREVEEAGGYKRGPGRGRFVFGVGPVGGTHLRRRNTLIRRGHFRTPFRSASVFTWGGDDGGDGW